MSEPTTLALAGLSLLSAGTVVALAGTLTRRADAIRADLAEVLTAVWHRGDRPAQDREVRDALAQIHAVAEQMEAALERLRAGAQRAAQDPTAAWTGINHHAAQALEVRLRAQGEVAR